MSFVQPEAQMLPRENCLELSSLTIEHRHQHAHACTKLLSLARLGQHALFSVWP